MRLQLRIDAADERHAYCTLWINGSLAVPWRQLSLRISEVVDFILLTKPDKISAYRENITEDLVMRIRSFKEFDFE
jgi:hypothetical protein